MLLIGWTACDLEIGLLRTRKVLDCRIAEAKAMGFSLAVGYSGYPEALLWLWSGVSVLWITLWIGVLALQNKRRRNPSLVLFCCCVLSFVLLVDFMCVC